MLRMFLSVGVMMTVGSGYVAYDFSQQASDKPDKIMMLSDYKPRLPFGVVDLMAKPPREGIASLPQVRWMSTQKMNAQSMHRAPSSTEDQIDEFIAGNPQLQAMVKADRAASKERWWGRIFQNAQTDDQPVRTNRLSAIRERNFPTRRKGIEPSSLSGMNAMQLFMNKDAIRQGLSATAANRMNAAAGAMEKW